MRIAGLNIFPLKSARGIALTESPIDAMGLSGDRRWMLINPDGYFITQREMPGLARLVVIPTDAGLTLSMNGKSLTVPYPAPIAASRSSFGNPPSMRRWPMRR